MCSSRCILPPLQNPSPFSVNDAVPGEAPAHRHKPLSGGFVAVIIFKYLKATAFFLVGAAVLRFVHLSRNGGPMEFARFLNANTHRPSVEALSRFFSEITMGQAQAIGAAALCVGLIFATEASLLVARVWWGTYFTVFLTALGIPLELIEISRHALRLRGWVFLAINVAILLFVWQRRNEFREDFRGPTT